MPKQTIQLSSNSQYHPFLFDTEEKAVRLLRHQNLMSLFSRILWTGVITQNRIIMRH